MAEGIYQTGLLILHVQCFNKITSPVWGGITNKLLETNQDILDESSATLLVMGDGWEVQRPVWCG